MNTSSKIISFLILFILPATYVLPSAIYRSEGNCDSLEVIKLYSLFSEYHKNKDYSSALQFGWQVISCNPEQFSNWIYYKMEDCLWKLHDSANVAYEEIKTIEDSILRFYDQAIKYYSSDKAYFQIRKAYVSETWLKYEPATVILEYEKALTLNPELSSFYLNRLGQLYINNMSGENDYKQKAIDIYSKLQIKEPDNPKWSQILSTIVESEDELLAVYKKAWDLNKDNSEIAWKYTSACITYKRYDLAVEPLKFLTQKEPEAVNYWNQLASAYYKTDQLSKTETVYIKLIELDPNNKDHYYNLGLLYTDQNKYNKARQNLEKANEIAGGWGTAIMAIARLYEKSASECAFDFDSQKVYQLAQDTYRRAYNLDHALIQARDRINALSGSIPTKEEWLSKGNKSGEIVPITGSCFEWIGKSITVP